jgi:hypothetical protein
MKHISFVLISLIISSNGFANCTVKTGVNTYVVRPCSSQIFKSQKTILKRINVLHHYDHRAARAKALKARGISDSQ